MMLTIADLLRIVSYLYGWLYFLSWSISFYPQIVRQVHGLKLPPSRMRSTEGLAFDFPLLNIYGSACYSLSSALFLYAPAVKAEYAARHPTAPKSTVRFNDFCFGVHSLLMCSIVASQFWPQAWQWKMTSNRKVTNTTFLVLYGSVASLLIVACVVFISKQYAGNKTTTWGWINVAYSLGNIKLLVTVFKFTPQIFLNYRRKSTAGLAMHAILLDVAGGIFSLVQLAVDASLQGDWSGVTSNPAKFGLANLSMLADFVFMVQHYALYRSGGKHSEMGNMLETGALSETDPLLRNVDKMDGIQVQRTQTSTR